MVGPVSEDQPWEGGSLFWTEWKLWQALPSCPRLFWQVVRLAASRTFCTAGTSRPIRMAMMAMTTRSSIRVNALRARIMAAPFQQGETPERRRKTITQPDSSEKATRRQKGSRRSCPHGNWEVACGQMNSEQFTNTLRA